MIWEFNAGDYAGADVLCARDRDFHTPNVIAFCRRYGIVLTDELELLAKLGT
jgi:hypothetical protein